MPCVSGCCHQYWCVSVCLSVCLLATWSSVPCVWCWAVITARLTVDVCRLVLTMNDMTASVRVICWLISDFIHRSVNQPNETSSNWLLWTAATFDCCCCCCCQLVATAVLFISCLFIYSPGKSRTRVPQVDALDACASKRNFWQKNFLWSQLAQPLF